MAYPSKKNRGRVAAFLLLIVGIAVAPIDHAIGVHIVVVSLIIIEHQLLNR
ncbi:MAG: hypothetical protein LAP87_10925 [Acidobacteriia bacterium]|nr:hypothetical protein [Terriglobia bacterium]